MAGMLFHRYKFPILKAFYIVYYVATNKKGISSTELSRKQALRQKTCWLFKKSNEGNGKQQGLPMQGKIDVDEKYVGGQDERAVGRNEGGKKIVVLAIEKQGKGISRMYGRVIEPPEKRT